MSLLENLLAPGTIERLGWMLVHILWQATAVAVLLAVFLRLLQNAGANVRYGIACSALALMVALPIVTMRLMKTPGPAAEAGPPSVIVTLSPEATAPAAQALVEATGEMPAVAQLPGPLPAADVTVHVPLQERIVSTLEPALPYVVLGWLVGVFGLSAWHLGGWVQLQRLRRRMVREIGRPLQQRLEELSIRLGVHRAVGLLESALIEVPTVVGWLRPVILLPASALTGLRPEQLEAILAHELAHVRRYDYLVNIVQTVVEILGFYHPAVWWVSRRIRIERENCCDDLAVDVCGSSLQYARALACMEEIRHSGRELAMAATGGSLMARIARLLGRPTVDDRRFAWLPGLVALLLVAGLIIPAALVLGTPQRPQAVEPAAVAATHDVTEPNSAPSNTESASSDAQAAEIVLEFKTVKVLDEARVDRETLTQIADALGIVLPPGELNRSGQTLDLTVGEVFRKYILPQPLSAQANETLIRLLQSQGSARALSAPRVLVRDGEGAKVEIFNTIVLPWSDPSGESEKIKCGTAMNVTPHVLDANWVNLEMMTEVSDPSGFGSNQPTVFRTSAETSVTAQNDRYLVWAAVMPTAAPAGPEADRRSVYIMVKPRINLPPQGLALAPDERRPDGTPPRHVLLDVRTVTMDSDALESLGVQWSRPTGGPSASVRTGSATDKTFTGALLTALDRLQADHQATVSSQHIIVQERYQSQIRALRDQWSAGAQPHKTETGTVVKVRPHVANDNTIRLELAIDTTRPLPTPPGSDLPMQSSQTCQSTVTIKDGGTAAIGGLSVPGAQGRPGQETVIFVTTRLLQDRKEAPGRAPQAAGPDTRVTPPVSPTPEQTASMRREYVNSDPTVRELSKSIVAMERDLITQRAPLPFAHEGRPTDPPALVDLKDKLASRRQELEKEFDNGLTARTGGSLGDRTENGKRATITATFTNTDLRDVLSEIAQRAGVKITPDATVKPTAITAELVEASPETALQQVLKNTPYTFRSIGDSYDVFRPQSFTFAGTDLVKSLRDLSASAEVPIVVDPNVREDVYVRFENEPLEEALQLMLAGKPLVFRKMPRYYLVARRSLTSQAFPDISVTRRVRLNHVQPTQVTQRLSPVFAPYVQAERPNPRDPNDQGNVLLVTAAPALLDRIVADIKHLDRPKRQVLLDARVVAMEKGNLLNLGVEWSWPTTQAGVFTSSGIVGSTGTTTGGRPHGVQIGYAPDQTGMQALLMALNRLEEKSQAEIIANPKVVTPDGHRAEVKVIEEVWNLMTTPPTKDSSHMWTQLQKIEPGTVLTITPFIGDNNDITLVMAVGVNDIIPARGSDLPRVTRRLAKHSVTVEDGGTVAVGGLTENRSKMTEQRVPVLSDIPLIGGLFRSKSSEKSNREVVVFVTAHLVPDTGATTPPAPESGATTVRIPPPTGESGPGRESPDRSAAAAPAESQEPGKPRVQVGTRFAWADERLLQDLRGSGAIRGVTSPQETETLHEIGRRLSEGKPLVLTDEQAGLLLKAAPQYSECRALSMPRVTVRENEPVPMWMGSKIPYTAGYEEPNEPAGKPKPRQATLDCGLTFETSAHLIGPGTVRLHSVLRMTTLLGFDEKKYQGRYRYQVPKTEDMALSWDDPVVPSGRTLLTLGPKVRPQRTLAPQTKLKASDRPQTILILVTPSIVEGKTSPAADAVAHPPDSRV